MCTISDVQNQVLQAAAKHEAVTVVNSRGNTFKGVPRLSTPADSAFRIGAIKFFFTEVHCINPEQPATSFCY